LQAKSAERESIAVRMAVRLSFDFGSEPQSSSSIGFESDRAGLLEGPHRRG
jgi:hypothetical protein